MQTDYAAGSRRLGKFFRSRGCTHAVADDLTQETWLRLLGAQRRKVEIRDPVGFSIRLADFVLRDHWKRSARSPEECCGDFEDEAKLIQLYPEGGGEGMCQQHPNREAAPGSVVCQECLDAMKARAAQRKAAGMCPVHPANPALPGKVRCQVCADRRAREYAKKRALKLGVAA